MEPPRDLTLPVGATATLRSILSAVLRRSAQDLARLPLDRCSPAVAEPLRALIRAAHGSERGPLFDALRRPNVTAPLRGLAEAGPAEPRDALDSLAAQLAVTFAVELGARGVPLPPLAFARTPPRVAVLGRRFALAAGGPAALAGGVWTHGGDRIDVRAAPPDRALYAPIEGELVLAAIDDNPFAMREAHPDKDGNAIDLGGRPADAWCAALREALAVIGEHLPLFRAEIDLCIHQLIPVGFFEERHLSASFREAIGTIYLSLHPRLLTMVEAVVHEASHHKINALSLLDPLLENAFEPLYPSPVRPDPRPLHGVLLAVHAFVPVEALYRRMRERGDPRAAEPGFDRRLAQIAEGNREGAEVLFAHARPTPVGRAILDELRAHLAAMG